MYGDIHHVGVWISQADILPCISPASPLYLVWISQAEARQRAGRAGRVRAGHNFKLYTSWRHTQLMQAARTPEMLRGPLQEVCLQLRLAPLLAEMPLRGAMARMIDTPPEVAVTAAVPRCSAPARSTPTRRSRRSAATWPRCPPRSGVGRLLVLRGAAALRAARARRSPRRSPTARPSSQPHRAGARRRKRRAGRLQHGAVGPPRRASRRTAGGSDAQAAGRARRRGAPLLPSGTSSRSARCRACATWPSQFWGQLAGLGLLPEHATGCGADEARRRAREPPTGNADNQSSC